MSMVHINESLQADGLLVITVEGILNEQNLSILKELCLNNLEGHRNVLLNLKGLLHASREVVLFLKEIQDKVIIEDAPIYMGLHRGII